LVIYILRAAGNRSLWSHLSTKTQSEDVVQEPTDERLRRLAVEAGKYLGQEVVPIREVVNQGTASGYEEQEVWQLLRAEGLANCSKVRVPPQGDLLGDLWREESRTFCEKAREQYREYEVNCGLPCAVTPKQSQLQQFKDYCSNNSHEWHGEERYDHTFNQRTAERRFARAKSVDRYFNREYDTYSTVMITYCADGSDKPIAQQAQSFYPRPVGRKLRDILKQLDVYDSYAGVSVLAPKYDQSSSADTHAHTFLWIPSKVSAEDFAPLVERHTKYVEGATVDQHGKASITVEHWGTNYREPLPHCPKDVLRGATSSLPHEVGNNLPWMKHPYADYVEEWSAALWQSNGENTIPRWRPEGKPSRFKQLADRGKYFDKFREAHIAAEVIDEPRYYND